MTSLASGGFICGLAIVVEDAPDGYYQGYNISLNSIPLWFRPYDGATREEAVREVLEALADMLRDHTGNRVVEVTEDDDDE